MDLIIRTVQRSDPSYQLAEMSVAVDRMVLGWTGGAGPQGPEQFVRVPGVAAGPHTVSIRFLLAGKGTGAYAYMSGYKFKVVSSKAFTLASAETTCISILLYFDPDLALPPDDRLGVDFREERAPVPNAASGIRRQIARGGRLPGASPVDDTESPGTSLFDGSGRSEAFDHPEEECGVFAIIDDEEAM